MTEFVTALSNGKTGTPVRVSAAFAESAGLKVVDPNNPTKSSGTKKASAKSTNKGGRAASKPEEA